MNKFLLAGSVGIALLSASVSPVWADDNTGTFSLGYVSYESCRNATWDTAGQ